MPGLQPSTDPPATKVSSGPAGGGAGTCEHCGRHRYYEKRFGPMCCGVAFRKTRRDPVTMTPDERVSEIVYLFDHPEMVSEFLFFNRLTELAGRNVSENDIMSEEGRNRILEEAFARGKPDAVRFA